MLNMRNALTLKNVKTCIKLHNEVGAYTISSVKEAEELIKNVGIKFFQEKSNKIIVTSDEPVIVGNTLKEIMRVAK